MATYTYSVYSPKSQSGEDVTVGERSDVFLEFGTPGNRPTEITIPYYVNASAPEVNQYTFRAVGGNDNDICVNSGIDFTQFPAPVAYSFANAPGITNGLEFLFTPPAPTGGQDDYTLTVTASEGYSTCNTTDPSKQSQTIIIHVVSNDQRVTFSADNYTVSEPGTLPHVGAHVDKDGYLYIPVSLKYSRPVPVYLNIDVTSGSATEGIDQDYTISSKEILFQPGQTESGISIVANRDTPGVSMDYVDELINLKISDYRESMAGETYNAPVGDFPETVITITDHKEQSLIYEPPTGAPIVDVNRFYPPVKQGIYSYNVIDGVDYKTAAVQGLYGESRFLDTDQTPTVPFTAFFNISGSQYQQLVYEISDVETSGLQAHSYSFVGPPVEIYGTYGNETEARLEPTPFIPNEPANSSLSGPDYDYSVSSVPPGNLILKSLYKRPTASLNDEFFKSNDQVSLKGEVNSEFALPWLATVASSGDNNGVVEGETCINLVFDSYSPVSQPLKYSLEVESSDGTRFTTMESVASLPASVSTQNLKFIVPPRTDPKNPITNIRPILKSDTPAVLSNAAIYRNLFSPNPFCPSSDDNYDRETYFCAGFSSAYTNGVLTIDGNLVGESAYSSVDNYSALIIPYRPDNNRSSYPYSFTFNDSWGRSVTLEGSLKTYSKEILKDNSPVDRLKMFPVASWIGAQSYPEWSGKPKTGPGLTGLEDYVISTSPWILNMWMYMGCPGYNFPDDLANPFEFLSSWNSLNSIGSYYYQLVVGGNTCPDWDGYPGTIFDREYDTYSDTGSNLLWPLAFAGQNWHAYIKKIGQYYRRREMSDSAYLAGMKQIIPVPELGDLIETYCNPYESLAPSRANQFTLKAIANTDPDNFYGDSILAYTLRDEPSLMWMHKLGLFTRLLQNHGYNTVHTPSPTNYSSNIDSMNLSSWVQSRRTNTTRENVSVYESYTAPNWKGELHSNWALGHLDKFGELPHLSELNILDQYGNLMVMLERRKMDLIDRQISRQKPQYLWDFVIGADWQYHDGQLPDGSHPANLSWLREEFSSEARLQQWLNVAAGAEGIAYFPSPGINSGYFYPPLGSSSSNVFVDNNGEFVIPTMFDTNGITTVSQNLRKHAAIMAYDADTPTELDNINNLPFQNLFLRDINGDLQTFYHVDDFHNNRDKKYAVAVDKDPVTGQLQTVYDTIKEFTDDLKSTRTYTYDGVQYNDMLEQVLLNTDPVYNGRHPFNGTIYPALDTDMLNSSSYISEIQGGGCGIETTSTKDDVAYVRWALPNEDDRFNLYLYVVNQNAYTSETVKIILNRDVPIPGGDVSFTTSAYSLMGPSGNRMFNAGGEHPYIEIPDLPPGGGTVIRLHCNYRGDFNPNSGWVPSGVDSGPEWPYDTSSPDDVDMERDTQALRIVVRPTTGRTRVAGWANPSLMPAGTVNQSNFVHGKFYISTSNPSSDPVNKVPNFRLRLEQGGTCLAENHYLHASTGVGGVPYEPKYDDYNFPEMELKAGQFLRPSGNPQLPSLYRADFDPVDVPAASSQPVGVVFESYSKENPVDGILSLHEVVLSTYPKLDPTTVNPIFEYTRTGGLSGGAGGPKDFIAGGFNYENDFQAGRLPAIWTTPISEMATENHYLGTSGGIILDTYNVPTDVFSNGLATLSSSNNSSAPRISPGKMYLARFYATSNLPACPNNPETVRQAGISFRVQTALGVASYYLRAVGGIKPGAYNKIYASQVLPGIDCQNAETNSLLDTAGEKGGWYSIVFSSPLDPSIRADNGGDLGALANEPGPGINLPSVRDITLGVDVASFPRDLRLSPSYVEQGFYPANRARVRVSNIVLYEFPQIFDGGYN